MVSDNINFQAERAEVIQQQKLYMKYIKDVQSGYNKLFEKHIKLLKVYEEQANKLMHKNNYQDNNSAIESDSDVIEPTQQPLKQKKFKSYKNQSNENAKSIPESLSLEFSQGKNCPPFTDYETSDDETYCSTSEMLLKEGIKNKAIVSYVMLENPPSSLLTTEPGSLPNDPNEVLSGSNSERDCQIIQSAAKKPRLLDSFDRFPEKETVSPKYAFKGPTVRKKDERNKLPGHECRECKKYYDILGLDKDGREARINKISRHKSRFDERPGSPPGLWDYKFPDSNYSSEK